MIISITSECFLGEASSLELGKQTLYFYRKEATVKGEW